MEKGAWLLGPLPAIRLAPRPWPFVEQRKLTISLGEQDKHDSAHIDRRANEDDVPIYGKTLVASESPGVEQTPHDGDNQGTGLLRGPTYSVAQEPSIRRPSPSQRTSQDPPDSAAFSALPAATTPVAVIGLH